MKKIWLISLVLFFYPITVLTANTVEINTASLEQLDELVGIGPALAQRIIDGRPYTSIDDLLNVKGIGEKTLQNIKDQGLATVISNTQITPLIGGETIANETIKLAPVSPPVSEPEKTYSSGIIINEILPAPEGPDETNEWIELYNQNETSVNLQGWRIKDAKGGTITHVFTGAVEIPGKGYLVLKRPQTKITLNNDEDGLSLVFPNGQVANFMDYTAAVKNQSYNKTETGWKWSRLQTPGAPNTIGSNTSNQTSLLKQGKSDISNTSNISVAAISDALPFSKKLNANNNPWFLFTIAVVITIISGLTILILKLTVFRNSKPNT